MVEIKAKLSVLAELRETFANLKSTSDIQIACGIGVYSAHRIMLASLSPFLAGVLRELGDTEAIIVLPNIYSQRLPKFLKILYGVEQDIVLDNQLISLFELVGINISQFINPLQSHQEYGLKPASYSEPLLTLGLDEDILRCEDLETILPHSLDKQKDEEVLVQIETIDDDVIEEILEEGSKEGPVRQCEVCRRACNSDNQYNYHKLIHSTEYKLAQSQGICIVCNKKFKKQYVQNHVREVHFLNLKGRFSCTHCGRNFTRKEKYEGHMSREHGAPMRYICNICGKLFSINSELYKHRALVHFAEAQLPCSTCGKLFKSQERLRRHQSSHLVTKPWKCDVCAKVFSRNDKLKSHMKLKHNL